MALRFPRRPSVVPAEPAPGARKVTQYGAGRYIGCPSCGRLLRIEWAVRSLVCSCGSRVPVSTPGGSGA